MRRIAVELPHKLVATLSGHRPVNDHDVDLGVVQVLGGVRDGDEPASNSMHEARDHIP